MRSVDVLGHPYPTIPPTALSIDTPPGDYLSIYVEPSSDMVGTTQERRLHSTEFAHYWPDGDGGTAMASLVDSFNHASRDDRLEEAIYVNHRLQVESHILQETPPEIWTVWPVGKLRGYVEANTAMDITQIW
jgi:hypothetical protein